MPSSRAIASAVRAKRGARWLDEEFPGWEERINTRTLDLGRGEKCICGQVFQKKAGRSRKFSDGFEYAEDTLFTEANAWINAIVKMETKKQGLHSDSWNERAERVGIALGFQAGSIRWTRGSGRNITDGVDVDYGDLQLAWENLLAKRAVTV